MLVEIDEQYLTQTAADLVRIDSRNPSLTPGSPGEAAAAAYTARALEALGADVTVYDAAPGRPNVIGRLRGAGTGPTLLLNAHLDTVGVDGMAAPFAGAVRDGRLYGRGSQDMKGSLAAMLAAARALVDGGVTLAGDLLITGVADEERASLGMVDLAQRVSADAAIVTEPTDMRLCRAHRGFAWFDVTSHGRAAHGSRYTEGIDAIMRMGRFLAELDGLEQALRRRPAHPLVGTPSLHASLIRGGTEVSVYAAACTVTIERRTCPGETAAGVAAELQALCDRLHADDASNRYTLTPGLARPPLEVVAEAPLVRLVDDALAARTGRRAAHVGATFWTDAAILAEAGIPALLLGPVGEGLHSAEEWVDLGSLVDLAAVLAATAVAFCGTVR